MKTILLDTNILLDIALNRKPFVNKAKELIRLVYKYKIKTFITATTITDIYYITRKISGHNKTIEFLKSLFEFIGIGILSVNSNSIMSALESNIIDFEDAVQIETAKQNDINIIITRNKDDFKESNLKLYNPDEYIKLFQKNKNK